jgi:signal transduction histidine kinase/ActR/RegA family two-component response regulator
MLHVTAVVVLAGGLFVVDLLVPLGVAVWLSYLGVVLLSLWFPSRWQTYATAAVCTALMLLGLFHSPPGGGPVWMAASNRLLGIFSLWVAAVVGLAARRTFELQEANRLLREEIGERERLQAQLLRSQRLESLGILASGIAHDFNNLLTPILMAAKLLREDRPDEERLQLLATLQASAERGAETVRQLLTFAGGTEGQRTTVHPGEIIQEVTAILQHTFPKTIHIRVDVPGHLPPVRGDATQLSQVLLNLCINARDAMPTGGRLVIKADKALLKPDGARLHPEARAGLYVWIAVADTGGGIPANVLDRIFDPFFTTKGPGKGTGLGLSTALGIVQGHGGFITVASETGRGSRFAVHLPAAPEETRQPEKPAPQQARGQGELILVVDDEPLILQTARSALEGRGYRIITARDGGEAVEVCRRHHGEVRAVVLDMMMPGMDGQETFMALEGLDSGAPIILSSGLRPSGRLAEAVAADRAAFLPKPYTEAQLQVALAAALYREGCG